MKITGVTPWLVRSQSPYLDTAGETHGREREYIFVEVSTDEGITGWGEVTGTRPVADRAVCAMLAQTSNLIEGRQRNAHREDMEQGFPSVHVYGDTGCHIKRRQCH